MLVKLFFATSRAFVPGDIIQLPQAPHLNNAGAQWLAMEAVFGDD